MTASLYHRVLRVSLVVVAFVLVFDSGMLLPITKQLSNNTISFVASSAVGMFARVEPNELNQITAQLTQRELELDAREASLNEREIATREFGNGASPDYSVYVLTIVLFMLTVLVLFNYYLDWRRVEMLRI